MFVTTDDTGRICCTSTTGNVDEGDVEFSFPDDFDFDAQAEYRIVDGELVHDPAPEPDDVRVARLKKQLADTDYVVIKMAEANVMGRSLTSEDATRYADIIESRRQWREEINQIEGVSE